MKLEIDELRLDLLHGVGTAIVGGGDRRPGVQGRFPAVSPRFTANTRTSSGARPGLELVSTIPHDRDGSDLDHQDVVVDRPVVNLSEHPRAQRQVGRRRQPCADRGLTSIRTLFARLAEPSWPLSTRGACRSFLIHKPPVVVLVFDLPRLQRRLASCLAFLRTA